MNIWILSFATFLEISSASHAGEITESKRAHIVCRFSGSDSKGGHTPATVTIDADLSSKTAHIKQIWDDRDDGNGNTEFSVLTNARASDSKDRETLESFNAIETSKGYTAPTTLVIAGNNGDDTDQTFVIQYRPGFYSEKEYKERSSKEADFVNVNLQYMKSCGGKLTGGKSVSCKMSLKQYQP